MQALEVPQVATLEAVSWDNRWEIITEIHQVQ